MRIAGVDPGVTGAIALFVVSDVRIELMECHDLPTMLRNKTGNAQEVNGPAFAKLVDRLQPDRVYIERVRGMVKGPGAAGQRGGAVQSFNFGDTFGVLKGVIYGRMTPLELVVPEAWKKKFSLMGAEKDASRAVAQRLFPTADLERKKDVGRAEAILIGYYGAQLQARMAAPDPFEEPKR